MRDIFEFSWPVKIRMSENLVPKNLIITDMIF
jgi:hypothetical protein